MILSEALMNAIRCIPVILSTVVLGAHFYRSGNVVLVGLLLFLPFILFIRRPWVPGFYVGVLLLGAAEWVRTLIEIAGARQTEGAPWLRMAIILGVVALATASSSLVFALRPLRERYNL